MAGEGRHFVRRLDVVVDRIPVDQEADDETDFRANDVISATTGNALSNPAGKYDPAVGPVGNIAGQYHSAYSLSADYRFSPFLSGGAGYAFIKDGSSLGNNARQYSLILNYDLSKRTRLYGVVSRLNNSDTARFKMTGPRWPSRQPPGHTGHAVCWFS